MDLHARQRLLNAYDHLTLRIVPGPRSTLYFLPFLATPLVLMLPPTILSTNSIHRFVFPVLVVIQVYDWQQNQSFDVISMNHVLMMFELLGYYDVRKDFKHVVRRNAGPEFDLEPYPKQPWARLQWVGILLVSLRFTDWHIGMPSHDLRQPSPIHPFKSFYLNLIAHSSLSCVLLYFSQNDTVCTTQPSWAFLLRLYAALSLYNSFLPSLIALTLLRPFGMQYNGMVSPLTWHSHFGSFRAIYIEPEMFGLRAFWGQFWHQNMRYLTSTPGLALASWLRLPTSVRYMMIVCISFFFSGIVHMGVIPAEPLHGSSKHLRIRLASFFWLQPIGIGIELLILSILRRPARPAEDVKAIPPAKRRSIFWQLVILLWTAIFLAITAGYTIRPVGCVMRWWNVPFL